MSLSVYEGTPMTSIAPSAWYNCIKEMVQMLVDYANCDLIVIETDSNNDYSAILYAGYDHYFKISTTETVSGDTSYSTIYIGTGTYNSSFSAKNSVSRASYSSSVLNQTKLYVVNDGDAWGLSLTVVGSEISSAASVRYIHLRGVLLRSSLNGARHISLGLYSIRSQNYSGEDIDRIGFPAYDRILLDDNEYAIQYNYSDDARFSIPDGQIMLFPILLCAAHSNNLGVTTINGKVPYMMSHRSFTPLYAYTEFYVGGVKYISLGYIAIRSK